MDGNLNESLGNKVDVIVPVFNGEATIACALESVFAQGEMIRRVIVIDDGSIDSSALVVAGLKNPKIELVRTRNGGVSAARNLGIERSQAEWIAFLDADDHWADGKLAAQLEAARSNGAGFVCTAFNSLSVMHSRLFNAAKLAQSNFVATSSVLVRRDVLFKIIPLFDSDMSFAEDYLAWLKCLAITPGYYLSDSLVTYCISERPRYDWGQITKNIWRVNLRYDVFLGAQRIDPKERLLVQLALLLGSIRSFLSIMKRFLASSFKKKCYE